MCSMSMSMTMWHCCPLLGYYVPPSPPSLLDTHYIFPSSSSSPFDRRRSRVRESAWPPSKVRDSTQGFAKKNRKNIQFKFNLKLIFKIGMCQNSAYLSKISSLLSLFLCRRGGWLPNHAIATFIRSHPLPPSSHIYMYTHAYKSNLA